MKIYRNGLFIAILSVVILLVAWNILLHFELKRASGIEHSLCKEMLTYYQRTGHLPPSLGQLADGNGLGAGWLSALTNNATVTYDPGATNRTPYLTIIVGHASIYTQDSGLLHAP